MNYAGLKAVAKAISRCDELLFETMDGHADKVAEIIGLASCNGGGA